MAKAKTPENKPVQVPAAELVGDHANLTQQTDETNTASNVAVSPESAEAGKEFIQIDPDRVGTATLALTDGTEVALGIDLGDGGSILTVAVFKDGILTFDVAVFELADLMTIVGRADDDDKREILKALQSYLGLSDTDVPSVIEPTDPADIAREQYRADYPALSRAMDDWQASGKTDIPTLRVVSKLEGFWCAGIQHSIAPVEWSMAKFQPQQAELLLTEPNLIIELI